MSDQPPIDPRLMRGRPQPPASAPASAPSPAPAAAPAPAPAPAKAPAGAPSMGEMLEGALTGLAGPSTYRALTARPAPSFVVAASFALVSGALSLAIAVAHANIENPGLLARFSPPLVAAVGLAALGLYGSVTLLLGVLLYGLGNALGGKGEFDRGLQAAAMMSTLWPVQMMCNWFPWAWVAPSLLAAWAAACALEGLFGARSGPTRALCAVLGAATLGVQAAGRVAVDRAEQAAAAAQALGGAGGAQADMARRLQEMSAQMQTLAPSAAPEGVSAAPEGGSAAPPPGTSGLDLLRGPSGDAVEAGAAPGAPPPEQAMKSAQGLQATAGAMLDTLAPMMDNPALTKNMPPEQKANMAELRSLMKDLRAQTTAGHSLSNAEFAAKMQRYQALTMKMMAAAAAAQAQAQSAPPERAPTAPKKAAPHLKLPEPGEKPR